MSYAEQRELFEGLFKRQPRFDGVTIQPEDPPRLASQLERVRRVLSDGRWHTLRDLCREAGGDSAAISARTRDLRKLRFGGHRIERKCLGGGVWAYRMEI